MVSTGWAEKCSLEGTVPGRGACAGHWLPSDPSSQGDTESGGGKAPLSDFRFWHCRIASASSEWN